MTNDNTLWAFVALLLFFVLIAYFKVPGTITKALDARAARIRKELEEARELKDEAKHQLAEYQRRRRAAEEEAAAIVAGAEREAAAILSDARIKSEEYLARRAATAEMKIGQAERDAIAEVRGTAVEIAVAAAGRILAERGGDADSARLMARSLDEVRRRLN